MFGTVSLAATKFKRLDNNRANRLLSPTLVYPEVAKRLNLEGTVRIEAVVGPDGQIKETKVIGGHPVLVESALKALRDWKYGKAGSETTVQLEFKFHP
jgi:TonB family protein